jgi:hypothetical protein
VAASTREAVCCRREVREASVRGEAVRLRVAATVLAPYTSRTVATTLRFDPSGSTVCGITCRHRDIERP